MKAALNFILRTINILNYVLCDSYSLIQKAIRKIWKKIFLGNKTDSTYTDSVRIQNMQYFNLRMSFFVMLVLSFPVSLVLAFIAEKYFQANFLVALIIAQLLIGVAIFLSTCVNDTDKKYLRSLEFEREKNISKWRLLTLIFVAFDVLIIFQMTRIVNICF